MFTVIQSNRLEVLAESMASLLKQPELAHPFQQVQVLVQSPGMSQWLKLAIAEHNGLSANIHFPLPSSFIWRLYQQLFDDLPDQSAFNKPDMTWKLYTLLPQFMHDDAFSALRDYLSVDDSQSPRSLASFRRYQLAEKIADVYDQYLVYRPDWIAQWESTTEDDQLREVTTDATLWHTHYQWQAILWRAMRDFSAEQQQALYHRGNLHEQLLYKLQHLPSDAALLTQLPSHLFVFGISAMPTQQLEVLHALSLNVPVFVYQFNPCAHYWGDIVDEKRLAKIQAKLLVEKKRDAKKPHIEADGHHHVGNPLLASLGKLGRDYFDQLVELDANFVDGFTEAFSDTPHVHALDAIQTDILSLSYRGSDVPLSVAETLQGEGKRALHTDDQSLVIHSCHSPMREVEVLHDQLLHRFAADPSLTPRDILVMMPDVGKYSPYIDAVFNSHQAHLSIPYAISDRGIQQENPVLSSFIQLLSLPSSRFMASDLLSLLDVPAIHRQFGIDTHELPRIAQWVRDVGIRWGIDAQHKKEWQLPEQTLNTWRFGVRRLLAGYALNTDALYDGVLPFTDIEGQDATLLGQLLQFIERVCEYRERLLPVTSMQDKMTHCQQLVKDFYAPNDDEHIAFTPIYRLLEALQYQEAQGNIGDDVSQDVFVYVVQQTLQEKGVGQRFLAGQVNFCTLMPMRSVPFRMICLLGMNDSDYPRYVPPVGFDLMACATPRKGDRSRRLDDRYLFLEALLSAREQLYISFVGRSLQDNSPKLPSLVVSELIDYCNDSFIYPEGEMPLYQHHLQPFNRHYFIADKTQVAMRSFQSHWLAYLQAQHSENQPHAASDAGDAISTIAPIPFNATHILLADLQRFMQHPTQHFFQHQLHIRLDAIDAAQEDDEVFTLDALQRYTLDARLIQEALANPHLLLTAEDTFTRYVASGELPADNVGEYYFDDIAKQSTQFTQRLRPFWEPEAGHIAPLGVNIDVPLNHELLKALSASNQAFTDIVLPETIHLHGWLANIRPTAQCFYRQAKPKGKQLIAIWCAHLALSLNQAQPSATHTSTSTSTPTRTILVSKEQNWAFECLEREEALHGLSQLITLYVIGQQLPIVLPSNSAWIWADTQKDTALRNALVGNSFQGMPGDLDDPYMQLLIDNIDAMPAYFNALAERVYAPIQHVMSPIE